jgi:hypothetical protein
MWPVTSAFDLGAIEKGHHHTSAQIFHFPWHQQSDQGSKSMILHLMDLAEVQSIAVPMLVS